MTAGSLEALLAQAKAREKLLRQNFRPRLSREELRTLAGLLERDIRSEADRIRWTKKRGDFDPYLEDLQKDHKMKLRLRRKIGKLLWPKVRLTRVWEQNSS